MRVKENHKSWTKDEWEGRKEALRIFIQVKIKELGIDNELRVPDFVLACSMVETMAMIRVSYRLGKQVSTGRHPTDAVGENGRTVVCFPDDTLDGENAHPGMKPAYPHKR